MLTYKMYTHVGSREINEDSVGAREVQGIYCFSLADGLGGHTGGDYASYIAINTVLEQFADKYDEHFLDNSFSLAQERVLEEQRKCREKHDMKTTLATLVIDGNNVRWGHIGDSRIYHFRKNRIVGRTLDHSVPQMLVNLGEIKEKDVRGHIDRNRLLRVIGAPWNKKAYELSKPILVKSFTAFLLCSDGFWELINEKTMTAFLRKAKNVDEWMDLMVKEIVKNGENVAMDNNSAIAVWMED